MVNHTFAEMPSIDLSQYDIRKATASELYPLRESVLYTTAPRPYTTSMPGDDDENTTHLVIVADKKIVSILSLMIDYEKAGDLSLYKTVARIRSVATDPDYRGRKYATILVIKAMQIAKEELKANYVWFSARVLALQMYERLGYDYLTELYDIPGYGLHRNMGMGIPQEEN